MYSFRLSYFGILSYLNEYTIIYEKLNINILENRMQYYNINYAI